MIEKSRIVKRIHAQIRQEDLLIVLRSRFGDNVATELAPTVNSVKNLEVLQNLLS